MGNWVLVDWMTLGLSRQCASLSIHLHWLARVLLRWWAALYICCYWCLRIPVTRCGFSILLLRRRLVMSRWWAALPVSLQWRRLSISLGSLAVFSIWLHWGRLLSLLKLPRKGAAIPILLKWRLLRVSHIDRRP